MKKIFALLLFSLFLSTNACVYAYDSDIDFEYNNDVWDNFNAGSENYGQSNKSVSEEEFEKAIEQVKEKQIRKKLFNNHKEKPFKGEEINQGNDNELLDTHVQKDTFPVISVTTELAVGEDFLPIGYYQVQGERLENGSIVLKLYQAQYLMAQFPAIETDEDFDQDEMLFANLLYENDNKVKLIYGSLDFNAYVIINVK